VKRINLLCSIVVAIALLFTASGVRATEVSPSLPSPGVSSPPRECTMSVLGGATVQIQAGPNLSEEGGLATQFPIPVTCGEGSCPCGSDSKCLKWQYRWTITGSESASLLTGMVSVDSDVTVYSSDPSGAQVSKIFPILAEGERFLTFQVGGGQTFTGSYFTPVNVTPGTLTAGFVGKKGFFPLAGRCALAGANNVLLSKNQPEPEEQQYRLQGCTIAFQVASDGRVIPGTIRIVQDTGGQCTLFESTQPITVDGTETIFVGAATFTVPGSCSYCFTNTYGGRTCSTCTACCVNKATGACVLKSTIPASQCKSGT
jgi:hypothetical protein